MNLMAPKLRSNHHVITSVTSSVMKKFVLYWLQYFTLLQNQRKLIVHNKQRSSGYVIITVSWLKQQETVKNQYPKRPEKGSTIPGNGYDK